MSNAIIPLYFVMLLSLSACIPGNPLWNDDEATPDFTPTPLPTPVVLFQATISADGQVVLPVPPQTFGFPSGIDGRVANIYVIPGQQVTEGQLLAEIDDTDLQNAVKKAAASLAVLQAEINNQAAAPLPSEITEAQRNLEAVQSELKRLQDLPTEEAITQAAADLRLREIELRQAQEAYDTIAYAATIGLSPQAADLQQATLNYEKAQAIYNEAVKPAEESEILTAQARVAEAENRLQQLLTGLTAEAQALNDARIYQAELDLAEARANLPKAKLLAPWEGQVTQVNAAPGVHIANATITLAQVEPLRFATTNFSERNLADIAPGDEATIFLKTYPNVPFPAVIQRIELESTEKDGDTALFTVYLDFNRGDLAVRPGMTGRVEIAIDQAR